MPHAYLTTEEAAECLRCTTRTVELPAPPRKKAVRSKGKARGYGDDPPPVRDGSARAELRPVMARLSTATLRELIGALEAEEGR